MSVGLNEFSDLQQMSLTKPKFHYADFPKNFPVIRVTGEDSGKSATCHGEVADMDHVTGKSQGCFGVSNHHKYT